MADKETDETKETTEETILNEEVYADQVDGENVEAIEDSTKSTNAVDPLQETKRELEELEESYLRLQAELQNIQRRNQREREKATRYRSQDLAKNLLPVLDNLERALTIEVEDEAGVNLKKGIEMVLESFKSALEAEGIEVVQAEGQPFDPTIHEAYSQVPAKEGQESGVVAQVFEKGYMLNDRVLRPAKVVVTE